MSDNRYQSTSRQLITYSPPSEIVESRMVPALDERAPNPQGDTPLAAYWYVLLKRRWTILAVALGLTAIGFRCLLPHDSDL